MGWGDGKEKKHKDGTTSVPLFGKKGAAAPSHKGVRDTRIVAANDPAYKKLSKREQAANRRNKRG